MSSSIIKEYMEDLVISQFRLAAILDFFWQITIFTKTFRYNPIHWYPNTWFDINFKPLAALLMKVLEIYLLCNLVWRPFWISLIFGPYQWKDFIRFFIWAFIHINEPNSVEKAFEPIFLNLDVSLPGLYGFGDSCVAVWITWCTDIFLSVWYKIWSRSLYSI